MSIRLTERGLLLFCMLLPLVAISIAVGDVVMLIMAIATGGVMVFDLTFTLFYVRRDRCSCAGRGGRYRQWVWEEKELELFLFCKKPVTNLHLPKWASLQEIQHADNGVFVRIKTAFDFYGSYRLTAVVEKPSFLRLYTALESIDTGVEFVVYPEALYWVLRIVRTLEALSRGFGEHELHKLLPTPTGLGEYIGSREYAAGMPIKRVDWRATAKHGKLYIKLFSPGGEAGYLLAFDRRCIGRYTCDRIASALLSTAAALAENGLKTSLCYVDEEKCFVFSKSEELLLHALNVVFQLRVVDYDQLYEFVEPSTVDVLQKLLKFHNVKERRDIVTEDFVYTISALLHDVQRILDMSRKALLRGLQYTILTPARPWIDARGTSEANAIRKSHENVVRALKAVGVNVVELDIRRVGGASK
jgi:uncharacterized protein (DUF58 family)